MAGKLEGKIALVTGGSTGIGFATAQRFVKEGAHVYITGRRQPELDEAVKKIGAQVTAVRADASNLADLDKLYGRIKQEQGRLDILFANGKILVAQVQDRSDYDAEGDADQKERAIGWNIDQKDGYECRSDQEAGRAFYANGHSRQHEDYCSPARVCL